MNVGTKSTSCFASSLKQKSSTSRSFEFANLPSTNVNIILFKVQKLGGTMALREIFT